MEISDASREQRPTAEVRHAILESNGGIGIAPR